MKVNGKEIEFQSDKTILDLLNDYNLNKDRVVVEINLEIVENEKYETYVLKEHDAIEIISFIGGG
ncbi:MAG: sulfur carrier protein ThiS [Terrisporobacter sp.]|uniref:sulfur carrier protein ThiS n=1 Tax=Terrisporobacter sp. TaxID=1965305 RepID=UPI002FC7841E